MTATRVYEKEEFGMTVAYTSRLKEQLEKVITHVIPLKESENVFELIAEPENHAMKVVLQCSSQEDEK